MDRTAIKGVVLVDGAALDIPLQVKFGRSRMKKMFIRVFGKEKKDQIEASPVTHIVAGQTYPPMLVAYVASRVPTATTAKLFVGKLQEVGALAEIYGAKNKTHRTINTELGKKGDAMTNRVLAFLTGLEAGKNPSQDSQLVRKVIDVVGTSRSYHIRMPNDDGKKHPLVFVLHGGGGNVEGVIRSTGFDQLAKKENFIVCFPHALRRNWNDGREAIGIFEQRTEVDDVSFISQLIDEIAKSGRLERKWVFVTGVSNGGMMAHRLGAALSEKIVAIAPVIGGMAPKVLPTLKKTTLPSLLLIQSADDPIVPFDGGSVGLRPTGRRGKIIPTSTVVNEYVRLLSLSKTPKIKELVNKEAKDITKTTLRSYRSPLSKKRVEFYKVHGGGHTWPGVERKPRGGITGKTSGDFQATKVIWQFFKSFCVAN